MTEKVEVETKDVKTVEINQQTGLPVGPGMITINPDLIARVAYVCENQQCGQVITVNRTNQVPLHCPFCGGPQAIAALVIRGEYTPDEIEQIKKAQAQVQQQQLAMQQAAAEQQQQQPGPRMRPVRR